MPSLFDTQAAPLLADAMQAHYGEPIVYRPMRRTGPNAGYEADPDRPVRSDITGAFVDLPEAVEAMNSPYDPRADQRLRHASARLAVQIKRSDLGYDPAPGDRIERTDHGTVFSAQAPLRDGVGDVTLPLNKAS